MVISAVATFFFLLLRTIDLSGAFQIQMKSKYDLDCFFHALQGKTWIEILRATQDEIYKLSRRTASDPCAAYLDALKMFEAYLLNPTYPLPEKYTTVIRSMCLVLEPPKAAPKTRAATSN